MDGDETILMIRGATAKADTEDDVVVDLCDVCAPVAHGDLPVTIAAWPMTNGPV